MRNYSTFYLIQFKMYNGDIITYLPDFHPATYPPTYAVFRVKLKDKRNWFQKLFFGRRWRKYWAKNLITSQVNNARKWSWFEK